MDVGGVYCRRSGSFSPLRKIELNQAPLCGTVAPRRGLGNFLHHARWRFCTALQLLALSCMEQWMGRNSFSCVDDTNRGWLRSLPICWVWTKDSAFNRIRINRIRIKKLKIFVSWAYGLAFLSVLIKNHFFHSRAVRSSHWKKKLC